MTSRVQPYRFLKSSEIKKLQTTLQNNIKPWIDEYAMGEIVINLSLPIDPLARGCLVKNTQHSIVHMPENYQDFFQKLTYGVVCCCFTATTNTLIQRFFSFLLQEESLAITSSLLLEEEWLYIGAPCLLLTLYHAQEKLACYLHPSWVYAQLKATHSPKPLITKNSILEQTEVQIEAQLKPFSLPWLALCQLQIGQIIQTDQKTSEEGLLFYQNHYLCNASIVQESEKKSIKIGEHHV